MLCGDGSDYLDTKPAVFRSGHSGDKGSVFITLVPKSTAAFHLKWTHGGKESESELVAVLRIQS